MAQVTLKKKRQAGTPGNFIYEYECNCANGTKHIFEVTSGNDIQAKHLAQMECDEQCGES